MRVPKRWYCEVYDAHLEFCLGWSIKSYSQYIKKQYKDDYDVSGYLGLHSAYSTDKKHLISVIWVKDKNNLPVVAHECLHSAIRILDHRNIKIDPNNQEPLTYLFDTIFAKAINFKT